MVRGLSCSKTYGIFPDQVSNPHLMHWQVDSLPLSQQGSPGNWTFFFFFLMGFKELLSENKVNSQDMDFSYFCFVESLEVYFVVIYSVCHTSVCSCGQPSPAFI